MKRSGFLLVLAAAVLMVGWTARNIVLGQTAEKPEPTVSKTAKQWEELVQQRIAQALARVPVTDEQVRAPQNWHRAIYNGVEYTIYTGPGQVMQTRWAQAPAATPTAKPGATVPSDTKGPARKVGG